MSLRLALLAAPALALMAGAMPAAAQSTLSDTHAEVWMPSGKVPQRIYRPLTRNDCAPIVRHHQSGKTMLTPGGTSNGRRCVTETAMRDAVPAIGSAR